MGTIFAENQYFFKTAVLTLEMDILTMAMVKHYSLDGILMAIMVDNGENLMSQLWFIFTK